LVDATGRTAWLAHRQGVRRVSYDHLVGVAGSFSAGPRDHPDAGHYTLIEAAEEGWWYSASLPNSQVLAIYMTDADLYAKGLKMRTNYWQEKLAQASHTRARVNSLILESGPFVVVANSSRLDRLAGEKWLAVGDAAVAFDPLSAQGISKALHSGMSVANVIQAYFSGRKSALNDYAGAIKDGFKNYVAMRNNYYRREMRWPESPFWQRRHSLREANEAPRHETEKIVSLPLPQTAEKP
jgi:flavin-dependent dehydrogenase